MTIQLQGVAVLNNPAPFTEEFKFQITFDCIEPGVKEELEWKLVYVGSADNEHNDQELDSILVGPVRVGKNRFTFTAPPPDPTKIPKSDLLDVTVILLTCSYKDQEFIRIGYYVHNEYQEELNENEADNSQIKPQQIIRNILADKPRVTRFSIKWDNHDENENQNDNQQAQYNDDNKMVDDEQESKEEEEDDLEHEDDEEEEDDEDGAEEEDLEEDLVDTEEADNDGIDVDVNVNANVNQNQHQENDTNEDDEDIDMQ